MELERKWKMYLTSLGPTLKSIILHFHIKDEKEGAQLNYIEY